MSTLALAFYGDDFTGSADVLMQCARWGMRGSILLGMPTADRLQQEAESNDLVGIAGVTRAMAPGQSAPIIEVMLGRLRDLGPRLVQYKICSTADSSPTVGSFRPAIEIGRELFGNRPVPVLPAQPNLGRYTAFSTHFAMYRGEIVRLDRQPIMANHPVTPMNEADLRRHVEQQLPERSTVGQIHLTDLHRPGGARVAYERATAKGHSAVIVDAVTEEDLLTTGRLLTELDETTAFGIGSAGLSIGFGRAFGFDHASALPAIGRSQKPCLAVSGSCSSLTGEQIESAIGSGWHGVALDASHLDDPRSGRFASILDEVMAELRNGTSVVVYTCGPDQRVSDDTIDARKLSGRLAEVVSTARETGLIDRTLIAGGDTSGLVLTALGAIAMTGTAVVGDHRTLAFEIDAPSGANHQLEVILKGGQIGGPGFFEQVRLGTEAGGAG